MDKEDARFILRSFRPDGADGRAPAGADRDGADYTQQPASLTTGCDELLQQP